MRCRKSSCNSIRSCWWSQSAPNVAFPNLDPTKHHVYSFSARQAVRAEAVCARSIAQRPFRPARRGRVGMQHPRCDDRLHRRRRQRLGGADRCARQGPVRRCPDAPRNAQRLAPLLRSPGGTASLEPIGFRQRERQRSRCGSVPPPMHDVGLLNMPPLRLADNPAHRPIRPVVRGGRWSIVSIALSTADRRRRVALRSKASWSQAAQSMTVCGSSGQASSRVRAAPAGARLRVPSGGGHRRRRRRSSRPSTI